MPTTGPVEELSVRDLGKYWLVGGRLIAKIQGGSNTALEESGGAGGEGESTEAGGEGEGESTEESEEEPEGQEGTAQTSPAKAKADKEYKERTRRRTAEQERDQLRKKLEELEDRDKSDLERATKRAVNAEGRVGTMEQTITTQAIEIAFLKASFGDAKRKPIQWVDADDALTLVRRELAGIKVGDDGEIDMDDVRSVVDDIAKRKSHLVRKVQAPAPSGGNVGSGQQPPEEKSAEQLAKTYGALRTRI